MDFKEGSIVKLKSGSPKMTIESIEENSEGTYIRCIWWNENASKFDKEVFPAVVLQLDDSKDKNKQPPPYSL